MGAAECVTHTINALRDMEHLDPVGQEMLRSFIQYIEQLRDREMERRSTTARQASLERLAVGNNGAAPIVHEPSTAPPFTQAPISFSIASGTSTPVAVVEASLDDAVPIRVDGEGAGDKRKRDPSKQANEVVSSRVAGLRMGISSLSVAARSAIPRRDGEGALQFLSKNRIRSRRRRTSKACRNSDMLSLRWQHRASYHSLFPA